MGCLLNGADGFVPLSRVASDYLLLYIKKVTLQQIYGMPMGSVIA